MTKWLGKKECDICKIKEAEFFVDGVMNNGHTWAFMCPACWLEYGIGKLGIGLGQKFDGQTLEKIG